MSSVTAWWLFGKLGVDGVAREHDPAYRDCVSAACPALFHLMVAAECRRAVGFTRDPMMQGSCHGAVLLMLQQTRCGLLLPVQGDAARQELMEQAAAVRAARRGPKATDIGLGLPGELWPVAGRIWKGGFWRWEVARCAHGQECGCATTQGADSCPSACHAPFSLSTALAVNRR